MSGFGDVHSLESVTSPIAKVLNIDCIAIYVTQLNANFMMFFSVGSGH